MEPMGTNYGTTGPRPETVVVGVTSGVSRCAPGVHVAGTRIFFTAQTEATGRAEVYYLGRTHHPSRDADVSGLTLSNGALGAVLRWHHHKLYGQCQQFFDRGDCIAPIPTAPSRFASMVEVTSTILSGSSSGGLPSS